MTDMTISTLDIVAALLFAAAIVHTFAGKLFEKLARRQPRHAGLYHLLGEVEVVFGFWAIVLVAAMALLAGPDEAIAYAESRQYTEPLFVFVVMVIAASRPVIAVVAALIELLARALPVHSGIARTWLLLAFVPLLGSLVTEPAAMTIAALSLSGLVFRAGVPEWQKYLALGVLFVNVSIGGTLTSYAAPPVLMVASAWQWDSAFMLATFGWKSAIAVLINASGATWVIRAALRQPGPQTAAQAMPIPVWVTAVHLAFLAAVVLLAHHPVMFLGLFLMFLGYVQAYEKFQSPLILKEGLLVGFFLAGLVVLGGLQSWWLQPAMSSLSPTALFFGAIGLTAIVDNAALTYLGTLITGISDEAKYMLVAGAVAGGGLTVIANAPNPAGIALLKGGFNDHSIGAVGLLLGAAAPTVVAAAMLFLL